jgi:hypothetical protein
MNMREMSLLFPNGLSKALTLSYDDGVEQDIRLVGIMNKYGLKGTFNLSGGLCAPWVIPLRISCPQLGQTKQSYRSSMVIPPFSSIIAWENSRSIKLS